MRMDKEKSQRMDKDVVQTKKISRKEIIFLFYNDDV